MSSPDLDTAPPVPSPSEAEWTTAETEDTGTQEGDLQDFEPEDSATDDSGPHEVTPDSPMHKIEHRLDLLNDRFEQLEFTLGQIVSATSETDGPPLIEEALADIAQHLEVLGQRLESGTAPAPTELMDQLSQLTTALSTQSGAEGGTPSGLDDQIEAIVRGQAQLSDQLRTALPRVAEQIKSGLKNQSTDSALAHLSRLLTQVAEGQKALMERAPAATGSGGGEAVLAAFQKSHNQLSQALTTLADRQRSEAEAMAEGFASLQERAPGGDLPPDLAERLDALAAAQAQQAEALTALAGRPPAEGGGPQIDGERIASLEQQLAALPDLIAERLPAAQDSGTEADQMAEAISALTDKVQALLDRPAAQPDLSDVRQSNARLLSALGAFVARQDRLSTDLAERVETALADLTAPTAPPETLTEDLAKLEQTLTEELAKTQSTLATLVDRPAPTLDLSEHRQSNARLLAAMDAFDTRQETLTEAIAARLTALEQAVTQSTDPAELDISAPFEALSAKLDLLLERPAPEIDLVAQRQTVARLMTALDGFARHHEGLQAALSAQVSKLSEASTAAPSVDLGPALIGVERKLDKLLQAPASAAPAQNSAQRQSMARVLLALDGVSKRQEALTHTLSEKLSEVEKHLSAQDPETTEKLQDLLSALSAHPAPKPDITALKRGFRALDRKLNQLSERMDAIARAPAHPVEAVASQVLAVLSEAEDTTDDSAVLRARIAEALAQAIKASQHRPL